MRAHTRSHGGILIYYFGSIFEITLSYWEATKCQTVSGKKTMSHVFERMFYIFMYVNFIFRVTCRKNIDALNGIFTEGGNFH